jgi:hypothetical protein
VDIYKISITRIVSIGLNTLAAKDPEGKHLKEMLQEPGVELSGGLL